MDTTTSRQMKAPTGYYRNIIGEQYPGVRIAFTHTPMYGVKRIKHDNILPILDSSDDAYAKYYADGLRNGSMVTIVEEAQSNRYFKSGELYFTT